MLTARVGLCKRGFQMVKGHGQGTDHFLIRHKEREVKFSLRYGHGSETMHCCSLQVKFPFCLQHKIQATKHKTKQKELQRMFHKVTLKIVQQMFPHSKEIRIGL